MGFQPSQGHRVPKKVERGRALMRIRESPLRCGWNLLTDLQIPVGTDILVTHTPPVGYGDRCATGVRAGCVELLNIVQKRVKPKYHVYGHIHEGIETWYHRKRLNNLLLGIKCLCFYVFRVRSAVGRQDRIHKRFSLWYQLHAQQQAHCIWHPLPPRILEIK